MALNEVTDEMVTAMTDEERQLYTTQAGHEPSSILMMTAHNTHTHTHTVNNNIIFTHSYLYISRYYLEIKTSLPVVYFQS